MSDNSTIMNARLVQLHDTEANWDRVPEFIPKLGEAVLFTPDKNHPYTRVKYGDGETMLKDLKFNIETELGSLFSEADGVLYFDGGKIKDYTPPVSDN